MHWMTAAELALGYRKKTFSPVEVTQHLLARIQRVFCKQTKGVNDCNGTQAGHQQNVVFIDSYGARTA